MDKSPEDRKRFGLVIDERLLSYNLGDTHPMNPRRIIPAMQLIKETILEGEIDEFELFSPVDVSKEYLLKAHSSEYVTTLETLSEQGEGEAPEFGLGTTDCPIVKGVAEASEFVVSSTVHVAKELQRREYGNAFIMLGGLHHASYQKASGFCYYNDINVAIHALKAVDPDIRILYLDTDLHHGDGTQNDFYNDPNVLTVSLHESGRYLFPGTGFPNEYGVNEGEGYSVNFPFMPYTWDDIYLEQFHKIVPALFESYRPDFVIWQSGVDGHSLDPLGHLQLSNKLYLELAQTVKNLVESTMDKPRILTLGGGGYNPDSVARSWLSIVSGLSGVKIPKEAPQEWVEGCLARGIEVSKQILDQKTEPADKYLYDVISGNEEYNMEFEMTIGRYFSF